MSILFTESFDKYGTTVALLERGVWTDGGLTNATLVANGGRCDTTSYRNTSTGSTGPHVGVTPGNQFSWGQVAIKRASSLDGGNDVELLESGGDAQTFFRFKNNGAIEAWSGPNSTLGAMLATSAAAVYSINTWFVFEWEVLVDGSAGTVQAWVDGVEVIALTTGLDTQANPAFATAGDWASNAFSMIGDFQMDDVVLGDGIDSGIPGNPNNVHLGPTHVNMVIAEADSVAGGGFYKAWTPLSGTDHGAMVDENPPDDDTSYNLSAAPTNNDTYTFPDVKISSGTVFAVNVLMYVKKSDAMNTREIKLLVRSGGSDELGSNQAVPDTQYEYRWGVWEGFGGAAWTVTSVNAAEFGLQDFA